MDPVHGRGHGVAGAQGGGMRDVRPCCRRAGGGGALVEPAALAALLAEAGHGYDLRRKIREITADGLDVDAGGLYRVLRRMEEEGLVTSAWTETESGPQRRDYELTPKGRQLAEDWVAHLRERERLSRLLADALSSALGETAPSEKGEL